jgi:putative transposase
VTARERRRTVERVRAAAGVSERRAIRFTGFPRSTVRYQSVREPQEELRARIRAIATERPRWGYRFIHNRLRREGWPVNRKRVQRLYREEGLAVRRKGKKRRSQPSRPVRTPLTGPNERWSMDFVSDTLSSGRRFRCLNIIDEFTRESVAQHVSHSIPAVRVIEVLERLRQERGLPEVIVTDNGSEFTSHAFDAWAYARSVRHELIQPGKPVQNCFIESFNGTFRDDCLNLHWFTSIEDASRTIEAWRCDYNDVRPHSSLDWLTPSEYGSLHQQREEALAINPDLPS